MAASESLDAYEAYLERHAKWNFVINVLDVSFYTLASSFIFGTTVLSLYASYLTDSATLIGLVSAITGIGYTLPQLLMARKAESLDRKKPLVQRLSVMERLPYLFVTLGILFLPNAPKALSFAILVLSLALATFSGGLATPAWNAMLAKVIRVERRGLLFGLMQAIGALLGIGGAAIARYILNTYAYPMSFGLCFLLAFSFQVVSWICLTLNREPARKPTVTSRSAADYWRRMPRVLGANVNFRRYLLARAMLIFGAMGTALYVVYGRQAFGIGDGFVGNLTIAALIGQTASTPILGALADRKGNKLLTELCAAISGAAVLLILLAQSELWLYGVFVLANIAVSGTTVAAQGMTMEFCQPDEVPTYSALASTLLSIAIILAPIVAGWIVDVSGYQTLFVIALVLTIVGGLYMALVVREPRHEPNVEVPETAQAA